MDGLLLEMVTGRSNRTFCMALTWLQCNVKLWLSPWLRRPTPSCRSSRQLSLRRHMKPRSLCRPGRPASDIPSYNMFTARLLRPPQTLNEPLQVVYSKRIATSPHQSQFSPRCVFGSSKEPRAFHARFRGSSAFFICPKPLHPHTFAGAASGSLLLWHRNNVLFGGFSKAFEAATLALSLLQARAPVSRFAS